jgi:hypothetical protein
MKKIAFATLFLSNLCIVSAFSSSTTMAPTAEAANRTPQCSAFSHNNRVLHTEHKSLKKEYRKLLKAIREHYRKEGCPAHGQGLVLPIENKGLKDKIEALNAVIRDKGIAVGG